MAEEGICLAIFGSIAHAEQEGIVLLITCKRNNQYIYHSDDDDDDGPSTTYRQRMAMCPSSYLTAPQLRAASRSKESRVLEKNNWAIPEMERRSGIGQD